MPQPTKQQTRDWLLNRSKAKTPPPSPSEIREQLGWNMLPNNKPKGKQ